MRLFVLGMICVWVTGCVMILMLHDAVDPQERLPQAPGEVANAPVQVDPLTPDEKRLFARIDARVDARLVAAVNEAVSQKKAGIGSALAVALGKLVLVVVKDVIAALVLAAVIALLWKYWYIVAALFSAVSAAGWLGGKAAQTTKQGG